MSTFKKHVFYNDIELNGSIEIKEGIVDIEGLIIDRHSNSIYNFNDKYKFISEITEDGTLKGYIYPQNESDKLNKNPEAILFDLRIYRRWWDSAEDSAILFEQKHILMITPTVFEKFKVPMPTTTTIDGVEYQIVNLDLVIDDISYLNGFILDERGTYPNDDYRYSYICDKAILYTDINPSNDDILNSKTIQAIKENISQNAQNLTNFENSLTGEGNPLNGYDTSNGTIEDRLTKLGFSEGSVTGISDATLTKIGKYAILRTPDLIGDAWNGYQTTTHTMSFTSNETLSLRVYGYAPDEDQVPTFNIEKGSNILTIKGVGANSISPVSIGFEIII